MAKRSMRLVLLVLRSELGRSLWNDVCLVSELVRAFALHICRIDLLPAVGSDTRRLNHNGRHVKWAEDEASYKC